MFNAFNPAWHRVTACILLMAALQLCTLAHAHVHWTQTNNINSNTVALFHFDDASTTAAMPAAGLAPDLGFTVYTGSAAFLSPVTDTPGSIFLPQALNLPATQTLRTTTSVSGLDGDLTIETWFKWQPSLAACSLDIGLQSGAKIRIVRDTLNSANDRFGISGTHGSYITAPGFTNWAAMGDEEASLGEWRHLALTVHSAGIHYDPVAAHDVYSTGTIGRLYYNGHAVGSFPYEINLSGLQVHAASRLTIVVTGGGMALDELTVWKQDWSDNGTVPNPFSNGRGNAGVREWVEYDE